MARLKRKETNESIIMGTTSTGHETEYPLMSEKQQRHEKDIERLKRLRR